MLQGALSGSFLINSDHTIFRRLHMHVVQGPELYPLKIGILCLMKLSSKTLQKKNNDLFFSEWSICSIQVKLQKNYKSSYF